MSTSQLDAHTLDLARRLGAPGSPHRRSVARLGLVLSSLPHDPTDERRRELDCLSDRLFVGILEGLKARGAPITPQRAAHLADALMVAASEMAAALPALDRWGRA